MGDAVRPALVVAQRLGHDPRPADGSSRPYVLSHRGAPGVQPRQVIWIPGRPLSHMRQLDRCPVRITCLQVDGRPPEAGQQLLQLLIRYRRHGPPARRTESSCPESPRLSPARKVQLRKSFGISDHPALHYPGPAVCAIHRGRASRVGIWILADERQTHGRLLVLQVAEYCAPVSIAPTPRHVKDLLRTDQVRGSTPRRPSRTARELPLKPRVSGPLTLLRLRIGGLSRHVFIRG